MAQQFFMVGARQESVALFGMGQIGDWRWPMTVGATSTKQT
jgi:hypothetical protein